MLWTEASSRNRCLPHTRALGAGLFSVSGLGGQAPTRWIKACELRDCALRPGSQVGAACVGAIAQGGGGGGGGLTRCSLADTTLARDHAGDRWPVVRPRSARPLRPQGREVAP